MPGNNITVNPGLGGPDVATEEIGGVHYQLLKLIFGIPGANEGDVSSSNPMPVYQQPFKPNYTQGQTVTPAATAASIDIDANAKQVSLSNLGLNVCYVRISTSALNAATTADYPILPGSKEIITKNVGDNKLSYISADGTTLHVMPGSGN
jgi:hypothetical protein